MKKLITILILVAGAVRADFQGFPLQSTWYLDTTNMPISQLVSGLVERADAVGATAYRVRNWVVLNTNEFAGYSNQVIAISNGSGVATYTNRMLVHRTSAYTNKFGHYIYQYTDESGTHSATGMTFLGLSPAWQDYDYGKDTWIYHSSGLPDLIKYFYEQYNGGGRDGEITSSWLYCTNVADLVAYMNMPVSSTNYPNDLPCISLGGLMEKYGFGRGIELVTNIWGLVTPEGTNGGRGFFTGFAGKGKTILGSWAYARPDTNVPAGWVQQYSHSDMYPLRELGTNEPPYFVLTTTNNPSISVVVTGECIRGLSTAAGLWYRGRYAVDYDRYEFSTTNISITTTNPVSIPLPYSSFSKYEGYGIGITGAANTGDTLVAYWKQEPKQWMNFSDSSDDTLITNHRQPQLWREYLMDVYNILRRMTMRSCTVTFKEGTIASPLQPPYGSYYALARSTISWADAKAQCEAGYIRINGDLPVSALHRYTQGSYASNYFGQEWYAFAQSVSRPITCQDLPTNMNHSTTFFLKTGKVEGGYYLSTAGSVYDVTGVTGVTLLENRFVNFPTEATTSNAVVTNTTAALFDPSVFPPWCDDPVASFNSVTTRGFTETDAKAATKFDVPGGFHYK